MPKYRIVRGNDKLKIGVTVNAENLKAAMKKEDAETRAVVCNTYGGLITPGAPLPVIAVYELVEIDPKEWS